MPLKTTIRTQLAKARTKLIAEGLMMSVQWHKKRALPLETGELDFDAPVTLMAVIEDADARVLQRHGIDVPVRASLTILDANTVQAGDQFTLPGDRRHPVVRCEPSVLDDTGTRFLTQVWLG